LASIALLCALAACGGNAALSPAPISPHAFGAEKAAKEHVLYSFEGAPDGGDPLSALTADSSGALYGTTAFGGTGKCFDGCGTVFKLTPSGSGYAESILYSFQGAGEGDGSGPGAGVVIDSSGAIYGTTEYGGTSNGGGIVFKLTPTASGYTESVAYEFAGGSDGYSPLAGLTLGPSGALYGATLLGGNGSSCGSPTEGCGTVFELKPSSSGYTETILHRFTGGDDGATPGSPPIFSGRTLYGTAATGGGHPSCGGAPINPGCGIVYKLVPEHSRYKFSVIHSFGGEPNDAANAFAGLVESHGVFYGVGQYGGKSNEGAVFSVTPTGSEKMLTTFDGSNGAYPTATLALGAHGRLYGTSEFGGGSRNAGVVFSVQPGFAQRVLYSFTTTADGLYPVGGILVDKRALYGTTTYGGTAVSPAGTLFTLSP
jgi:hypothetical protein